MSDEECRFNCAVFKRLYKRHNSLEERVPEASCEGDVRLQALLQAGGQRQILGEQIAFVKSDESSTS